MILTSWMQFVLFLMGILSMIVLTIPSNLEMGSEYLESFQYDKAFKYFSRAQKNNKTNLANLKRLKELYLIRGELDKAMILQEKLVQLRPQNHEYWKDMVELYDLNLMPYEKFKAREREIELMDQSKIKPHLLEVAEGYRWLQKFDDANRVFNKLLLYNDPALTENIATYYSSTGQAEKALDLFKRNAGKGKNAIYYRWLAEYAEASEKYTDANEYYRQALTDLLGTPFKEKDVVTYNKELLFKNIFYLQKMNLNYQKNKEPHKSEELLNHLTRVFPEELLLSYDLGYFYLENGQSERAYDLFTKLESREKKPDQILDICETYASLKYVQEAHSCLIRLTDKYPTNARYLDALAESFIRLGDKVKALRILEKILKIEGETSFVMQEFEPLAQALSPVSNDAGSQTLVKKASRRKQLSPDQLDELRQRIIYLQQDIGEGDKSETILKALIEKHPKRWAYRKQLGYVYLNRQQLDKGYEQFEEVLKLKPDDQDSLYAMAERDFRAQKFEESYRKLKKLDPGNVLFQLEFREEVLFVSGHKGEYEDFCLNYAPKFKELELRCKFRTGDKVKATGELETFLDTKPDNHPMRATLVSWLLELHEMRRAEKQFNRLKAGFNDFEEGTLLSNQLKELQAFMRLRRAWIISATSAQVMITDYDYNISSLDVLKRLNGPGVGVWAEHLASDRDFTLISPYFYYGNDSGEFKIGPTLSTGDKNLKTPFFVELNSFKYQKLFGSFHFENSRPEFQIQELLEEKDAYRRNTSLFLSYHEETRYHVDLSLDNNGYTFNKEHGNDWQLYSEALIKTDWSENFHFGPRVFNLNLNSAGENINRLHIKRAFAYYMVLQYANSFFKKRYSQWNYLAKAAIGGDGKRSIGFGDALNFRLQTEYMIDDQKGIQLFAEHYKESYLALVNKMNILGLNFFYYF